ncbi:MAG: transglutaminase domain-containing protein [Oscillospiraceae bacterium]|nr:transglutaminase domain-containing protein [Oscillospiraceae bacterium]
MKKCFVALACVLLAVLLASCGSELPSASSSEETQDVQSAENPSVSPEGPSVSPEDSSVGEESLPSGTDPGVSTDPAEDPAQRFTFSPYIISDVTREELGEADYALYCKLVDAYLAHEERIAGFSDEAQFFRLWGVFLAECYPSQKIAANYGTHEEPYVYTDGTVELRYQHDRDECDRLVGEFEEKINSILSVIDEGDDEVRITEKLYRYVSDTVVYDFIEGSMYEVIMQDRGICGDYAAYLILLLRCAGVESIFCSDDLDSDIDHAWTIAKLNGEYYHFDPTWQANEPGGWTYFAMSDDARLRTFSSGWFADLSAGIDPYTDPNLEIPDVSFIGTLHPFENVHLDVPACTSHIYDEKRFGAVGAPSDWN